MASLAEQIAVREEGGTFFGHHPPKAMGNAARIAYGGYAIATAIHCASLKAPAGYYLYTALGNFLRPANIDQPLRCEVVELRQTKSFAGYQATVHQGEGKADRVILVATIDFHKTEPALLEYCASPKLQYSSWEDCSTFPELRNLWRQQGKISAAQDAISTQLFKTGQELFEVRTCPEGVAAQNLNGSAKSMRTTQDHLSPAQKTSADWLRSLNPLHSPHERAAALAFTMDGAISFIPLVHNHLFLEDAGACSSLDFALRVFHADVDVSEWHMRELTSVCTTEGRSYGESRLWSEGGELVASMTQQCILRTTTRTDHKL